MTDNIAKIIKELDKEIEDFLNRYIMSKDLFSSNRIRGQESNFVYYGNIARSTKRIKITVIVEKK